jgi:hypothetical protein
MDIGFVWQAIAAFVVGTSGANAPVEVVHHEKWVPRAVAEAEQTLSTASAQVSSRETSSTACEIMEDGSDTCGAPEGTHEWSCYDQGNEICGPQPGDSAPDERPPDPEPSDLPGEMNHFRCWNPNPTGLGGTTEGFWIVLPENAVAPHLEACVLVGY